MATSTNITTLIQETIDSMPESTVTEKYLYESGHQPLAGRLMSWSMERELRKVREEFSLSERWSLTQGDVEHLTQAAMDAIDNLHKEADERARVAAIPAFRYLKWE